MPICHGRKFIFVHIPKNAGSTVEVTLGIHKKECMVEGKDSIIENGISYSLQHLTSKQLKTHNITKNIFDTYFKFAFVRNPYQRVLSEYFWLNQKNISKVKVSPENFTKWIDEFYSVIDKDHKLTQYEYLYDENKNVLVDFIGTVENFDEDFTTITKKFGRPMFAKEYNSSRVKKSVNHSSYLTQENKEKIYNLFKIDFETFGYER